MTGRAIKIEILYVDPNKVESVREEIEEKIKGKRKPAWGRLEEGGRVVNIRVGKAARKESLDGKLDSSRWIWNGMERKCHSEQRYRSMPSPGP